ncbi:MAG TPA: M50 family metallopeptidase [Mycobacteriales bacterium]
MRAGLESLTPYRLDPSTWLVLATAAVALVAVAADGVWRWSRNVVTIVHEAGHAIVALATGRRLTGIRLHSDTSGLTLSVGRPAGPGMVLTTAAGYLSPSVVGLVGAAVLTLEQVTIMLWVATAVLLGMLVMVRNAYGIFTLVVTGAVLVAVSLYTGPGVQAAFGYAATWFLLLGGVRPVDELRRERRRLRSPSTDADQLARLTGVPGGFWVAVFALLTSAALAAGGWLLLT